MAHGDLEWRKSSYSELPSNDCVEICFDGESVLVRDSKNPTGPVLRVSTDAWSAFIETLRGDRLRRTDRGSGPGSTPG
jgi:hypothetical protein